MPATTRNSNAFSFVCSLAAGLHARPASCLVEAAARFSSESVLTNLRNGASADLKSVLAIIAADVRQGDECSVQVRGADEGAALAALRHFMESDLVRCDEPSLEPPPPPRKLPRVLRHASVTSLVGTPAGPGIGEGAVVVVGGLALPRALESERPQDTAREQQKLEQAITAARVRIETALARETSRVEAGILKAQLAMVSDLSLIKDAAQRIARGRSAGQAIAQAAEFFINILRRSQSQYVRERAIDMQEVALQLLEAVYGVRLQPPVPALQRPSVVVAETLAPQQLLALNRQWLKGLVLEHAGITSHAIILARSLGIPTVVGAAGATGALESGQEVVLDASRGVVLSQSDPAVRRFYARELAAAGKRRRVLEHFAQKPTRTRDGQGLEIAANVSTAEEVVAAFENGADGIGMFRTEMLFLGRDDAPSEPPSEQAQFEFYAGAVRAAAGRPVIFRTIDAGGDKPVPYLNLRREANPFLGSRGVRIYDEHEGLVRTQLRAILRASGLGRVQILLPMVSAVAEVRRMKALLTAVQNDLAASGIAFDPAVQMGIMIEVPMVGFALQEFCEEADFFSLGTNDLAQYFFAAERGNPNPKLADLADVLQPAFLRFLKQLVDEARRRGKWIGICGEMAGEIAHLRLLVGLGLDEISVPASAIPALKERTSLLDVASCRELLLAATACHDAAEVRALLQREGNDAGLPLLDRELVLLESTSESKEEVLRELANAMFVAGRTDDADAMEEALWARESLYSTSMGYGFAVPHCKSEAVKAASLGLLKLQKPLNWQEKDWQEKDGQEKDGGKQDAPVQCVILLALPAADSDAIHMQLFSRLARKLMDESFRQQLFDKQDAAAAAAFLGEHLQATSQLLASS